MSAYFEDFQVGQTFLSPAETLSRERLVAYAERYDPQGAHTDERLAAASPFRELVASGWQTASLAMRLQQQATGLVAEPGPDTVFELRWHRPVRPGDRLQCKVEITGLRDAPRPGHGLVSFTLTATDEAGETVQTMLGTVMAPRRPGA